MDDEVEKQRAAEILSRDRRLANAWQPFTPLGVAAFSRASSARLMVLQFVVGLIAAVIVLWFFSSNFSPAIHEAIRNLPDETSLQNGQLTNISSRVLTEKKFLSIVIDLEEAGRLGKTADLQTQLRKNYFQICSIFGCVLFDYPKDNISIGHSTSEPWWGARQPIIFAFCGATTVIGLFFIWAILASIYAPIAKLFAYFGDRELSWSASWRLASAAQMTGALLMSFSIFLYGIQAFDLIRFLFFFCAHFVVAWVYLSAAPFSLPKNSSIAPPSKNPFS